MAGQHTKYPRIKELIDRLVESLVAVKGWSLATAMAEVGKRTHYSIDMVYRWRQGKVCPSQETLEILVKLGKEQAGLEREWGESLLHAAHYPDTMALVNKLWGPKEIRAIPCNLPSRDSAQLIGRQSEITRLLQLLSPEHTASLITVDGIGGVGKTALVLEIAYRCWKNSTGEEHSTNAPRFDAIILVSAKQQHLTSEGILPSYGAKRTLRDIKREIAATLNIQSEQVDKYLGRQPTLLIVDNLETMEDKQEIVSYLYEMPHTVKVIMTTRERVVIYSPIRLDQLSQEESLVLIEKEAQEKEAQISSEQALSLYHHIGGIPAALIYAIGQVAGGYSVETVMERIPQSGSDVTRFCFESSLEPLRGQPAHHLLMAMAMFSKSPLRGALAHTAGLATNHTASEDALAQLRKLSLIGQQEGRYTILPLTREYALSELAAFPAFEQEARERWVEWYANYALEFGGKDRDDWTVRYDHIEEEWENLLAVFDWCAAHERYKEIQTFWQGKSMDNFAHIYSYWEDRQFWLDWLSKAAEKRGDWSHALQAMIDLSFTLTLMNQFKEADSILQHAWETHEYAKPRVQLILMQKITNLCTQKGEFADAISWSNKAYLMLNSIENSLEEPDLTRRRVDLLSNEGLIYFKQKDYQRAEVCFRECLKLAEAISWNRVIFFARNHLVSIAIAQNQLEEAETLLQISLPVERDKRLAAFHKLTSAYFCQKKGNMDEARRLARAAFDSFERLGMRQEAQETDELLKQLAE
jgi:tetratricopeptide (TPR) repeat protein